MSMIKLTNHVGLAVYVDPKFIIAIDASEHCTDILVTGGNSVLCKETPDEILKLIKEQNK